MSWTYSGDPATSPLDEVRFWTQDVVPTRPLLSDEEINFLITKWYEPTNSLLIVSSVACEVIAAKVTPETNVSADGVSVSVGDLQQRYITLAQRLRDQAKMDWDDDDMDLDMADDLWDVASYDSSLSPLVFGIGFMDNWEVGRADFGSYHPGRAHGQTAPTNELAPAPVSGAE